MSEGVEFVGGWDTFKRELQGLGDELKADVAEVIDVTLRDCSGDVIEQYAEVDGGLKAGVKVERDSPLSGRVRSMAPHAHLYELGTVARFINSTGANRGVMPATPVMIPTAIKYRDRMQGHCEDVLKAPRRTSFGSGSLL